MQLPDRYASRFQAVDVPGERVVMTSVGARHDVKRVWRCRICGKEIKPNSAGAQSHIAKHLRLSPGSAKESK